MTDRAIAADEAEVRENRRREAERVERIAIAIMAGFAARQPPEVSDPAYREAVAREAALWAEALIEELDWDE